jgi:hypothetical protein
MTWEHKVAGESRWRQGRTDLCLVAAPLFQVVFFRQKKRVLRKIIGERIPRPDKSWTLTDCISFEAIRRHGLTESLTGDRPFEQPVFKALLLPQPAPSFSSASS